MRSINADLKWPFVVLVSVIVVSVSAVVIVSVLKGVLGESALWALGAWLAGMIKGALIPMVAYSRQRAPSTSEGGPSLTFPIDTDPPPPPSG